MDKVFVPANKLTFFYPYIFCYHHSLQGSKMRRTAIEQALKICNIPITTYNINQMRLFFHKNCHLIQTKNYVDSKAPNFPEKQTFHECNNKFHLLSFSHTEIINVPAISEYIDVQNYIDSMNKTEIISLLQSNPNFDQFQCRIENELLKKEHNRLKQKISSLTYENTQLKQKITELNSSFCELSNKFSEIKAKSEKKNLLHKICNEKVDPLQFTLSCLTEGLSFSQAERFLAKLNIATISEKHYLRLTKKVDEILNDLTNESLRNARSMMNEKSSISFDSAWSHPRNAHECFGAFIDLATQKIIDYYVVSLKSHWSIGNCEGFPQSLESEILNKLSSKWCSLSKIDSITMDNDNNVGGIFTKLNWKIIQFIDVNHAYKQFKSRFLKFNFDNKNIFSDIIKSFLKFVKVLMLDRDLPLITKKEQFFNITEHFSNNHQKCLHENLIDFKIPAFAKNINLKNRLDTFLDDNVIIFEKTEPHKNTQCNESLHSFKIKLAPKNKSWKMTFSTRMKITVLLWNEGHKFYYQLMNNFNIAELNDHNKQIIDKYILRKTLNKEKQQTEKYIQQKNKTRNLRRQSGRKEGDYKLKKVFTPINIEFRETDVLHSDFKEEEETNDLDFRETNFNSPEEDSFFKDINADDWFSMTIFDLFNFGKLFLDQALLGNIFRLYNIANNCYINSGIQLLMSSEHFRTKLLLFNKEDDLLLFLKKCTKDIVNKRDIDYIINYYINNSTQTIKYNEKGDTSAFLLFLLNDLEEKYNMIANMTGFIAKSILCSQCGARNEVLENNLLYSISCSELQNIEDCCKNEPINDSICQFCRNTPLMMTQIVSINILLIIHLTDSNYEQIFHIKETLHINQKLYSMKSIVYFRDLPDSGHYFDVVRQNNKWFLISDSFINQIKSPFEIDKKSRPEILLYEQIMQDL